MTNLPLSELEAALKKATPAPWTTSGQGNCAKGMHIVSEEDTVVHVSCDDCNGDDDRLSEENAALIVLLRNNADALVEAAKKAEELEVAHELSGQRYANAIELWGEKKARAEESARKLAEAEREVAALKEELAGNVRRESAVIDQQTPPDDELRLIIQVEEEGGTVSLLAIVAKRLLEARRLVRWHMAIGGEYEALQAENAKLREAGDAVRRLSTHRAECPKMADHACNCGLEDARQKWEALSSPPKSAGTKEDECSKGGPGLCSVCGRWDHS